MLPDIIPVKQEVGQIIQLAFKQRINAYLGVLSEAPRRMIKEGRRVIMIRPNGDVDETELMAATGGGEMPYSEVPNLTLESCLERMDSAAREIARQISRRTFEQLDKVVERVGNVVDARDSLGPETMFELIEKIHLDFDEHGQPHKLTLVASHEMGKKWIEMIEVLEHDQEYSKRFENLMDIKRREWRDREAARRLVG